MNIRSFQTFAIALIVQGAAVLATNTARGAITYLDALEGAAGNTFATGGSLADTSWVGTTGDTWESRDEIDGINDTVFEPNTTAPPELTTQIAGLADGTYEIWVFYWDQVVSDSNNWIISTGLTSGALASYSSPGEPAVTGATSAGVVNAAGLTFTAPLTTVSSNGLRNLFGVSLGQVTVSGGAPVNVHVDNLINNLSTVDNRTWFDGVGYELVPEPPSGQITYVDAIEGPDGNTSATGGTPADTSWLEDPGSMNSNQTQWGKRSDVGGNGNQLLQASHTLGDADGDSMPELTTRIENLAAGTYEIWAFFWDQIESDSQNWTLSAGLVSGALTSYSAPGEPAIAGATTAGVFNAAGLNFSTPVTVVEGGGLRNLFGIRLGETTVSGGAPVSVFVDNLLGGGTGNRSWYDGVGYIRVSDPTPFAITAFELAPGGDAITLTWDSQPGETFTVRYSTDMSNWSADLDDSIMADAGDSTTRSYDISGLDEGGGQHFFRVEK